MIQACYDACQLRVVCSVFTFWFPDCRYPGFSGQCRFSLLIIWLHLTSAWMEYSFDALLNVHDSNSAVGPCVTWYAAIVAAWVATGPCRWAWTWNLNFQFMKFSINQFSKFGGTQSFSIWWNTVILNSVELSQFSILLEHSINFQNLELLSTKNKIWIWTWKLELAVQIPEIFNQSTPIHKKHNGQLVPIHDQRP